MKEFLAEAMNKQYAALLRTKAELLVQLETVNVGIKHWEDKYKEQQNDQIDSKEK